MGWAVTWAKRILKEDAMKKTMIGLGIFMAVTAGPAWAENFCCNPETYRCEDCQACPRTPCPGIEGHYIKVSQDGNEIGELHIYKTAETTYARDCFYNGNEKRDGKKCHEYFLKEMPQE